MRLRQRWRDVISPVGAAVTTACCGAWELRGSGFLCALRSVAARRDHRAYALAASDLPFPVDLKSRAIAVSS
jgi:hypothetical protein